MGINEVPQNIDNKAKGTREPVAMMKTTAHAIEIH